MLCHPHAAFPLCHNCTDNKVSGSLEFNLIFTLFLERFLSPPRHCARRERKYGNCIIRLLSFLFPLLSGRYCWRKYRRQSSSGNDMTSDKSTDPLAEKNVASSTDEVKFTIAKNAITLKCFLPPRCTKSILLFTESAFRCRRKFATIKAEVFHSF